MICCYTYGEAINFIKDKGGDHRHQPVLASEMYTYLCPHLMSVVPSIHYGKALDALKRQLSVAVELLDPLELRNLKKDVREGTWAYDIVHRR